jgi:hypothetical protein
VDQVHKTMDHNLVDLPWTTVGRHTRWSVRSRAALAMGLAVATSKGRGLSGEIPRTVDGGGETKRGR